MEFFTLDKDGDRTCLTGEQGEDTTRFCTNPECTFHVLVPEDAQTITKLIGTDSQAHSPLLHIEHRERHILYLRSAYAHQLSTPVAVPLCNVCASAASSAYNIAHGAVESVAPIAQQF
jgi:hypothetical protein